MIMTKVTTSVKTMTMTKMTKGTKTRMEMLIVMMTMMKMMKRMELKITMMKAKMTMTTVKHVSDSKAWNPANLVHKRNDRKMKLNIKKTISAKTI